MKRTQEHLDEMTQVSLNLTKIMGLNPVMEMQ